MIHLDFNAVILLILGSVLTLVGGFASTYFSQFVSAKAEKRKIVREKIEEIYTLIDQVDLWLRTENQELAKFLLADKDKPFTLSELEKYQPTLARIKTLVRFYAPSLSKEADEYFGNLKFIRQTHLLMNESKNKKKETEEFMRAYETYREKYEKLQAFLEKLALTN